MKTIILTTTILLLISFSGFSQSHGRIEGKVFSSIDSNSIPGANIRIMAGQKLYGGFCEVDGRFSIKAIEPGSYTVLITFSGCDSVMITDVPVNSNQSTSVGKIYLGPKSLKIVEVKAKKYEIPLIQEDGGSVTSIGRIELVDLPINNSIPSLLNYLSSEFFVSDNQQEVHFRGSRDGETAYYVDGVRVNSTDGIPSSAMRSFTIYSGGIPAKYGDFQGGVVVIETMSYSEWVEEKNKKEAYWRDVYAKKEQEEKEKSAPAPTE